MPQPNKAAFRNHSESKLNLQPFDIRINIGVNLLYNRSNKIIEYSKHVYQSKRMLSNNHTSMLILQIY